VAHASGLVEEAVAFGVPHPVLGQAIVLLAVARAGASGADLLKECQRRLPAYMVPAHVALHPDAFPRNPNGKIDRNLLRQSCSNPFEATP
jgi:acyl-CoA synthetase (AMP-forming)/AMP-acid ligase II